MRIKANWIATTTWALLLPTFAPAEEDVVLLPEVQVTASRLPRDAGEVPYRVETFGEDELRLELPRTLPEAFHNTPGVLVQKTTPGHGSPYIRGFTGRQNLLLFDGIRLNNSTWRGGAGAVLEHAG